MLSKVRKYTNLKKNTIKNIKSNKLSKMEIKNLKFNKIYNLKNQDLLYLPFCNLNIINLINTNQIIELTTYRKEMNITININNFLSMFGTIDLDKLPDSDDLLILEEPLLDHEDSTENESSTKDLANYNTYNDTYYYNKSIASSYFIRKIVKKIKVIRKLFNSSNIIYFWDTEFEND